MIVKFFLGVYGLIILAFSMLLLVSCSKKELDYVVLGDSTTWGFPKYFAAHIENDLEVRVKVHDRSVGGLSTGQLLEILRNDKELRNLISEADVITYIANPVEHIGWRVVTGEGWHDCSEKALAGYKEDLDEIIDEILTLRGNNPTIIRAMDFYVPIIQEWKKRGEYDENKRCWEAVNRTIQEVAAEYNIPVAHIYDAFNGLNHDEDPREKGYIGDDSIHTNEKGQKVIAELFQKLGYEPVIPDL